MSDVSGATPTQTAPTAPNSPDRAGGAETRAFAAQPQGGAQVKTQAGAVVGQATDQAASALAAGMDMAQEKAQALQQWASDQRDTNRERIRAHPITSCAATFGVGLILGMLLAR